MSEFIKAAVIGHPISHSKSPIIHNHWIEKYALNGSYEAIDIHPDNLSAELDKLIAQGYSGFNFTLPHKELVLPYCDELEQIAEVIGAVNCLSVKDGKKIGSNTDSYGFLANLTHQKQGIDFQGGAALVIGAGGAARAIVSALMSTRMPRIYVTNRTFEKAQKLADELNMFTDLIVPVAWDKKDQVLDQCTLIVNTTSLGMDGEPDLEIDFGRLSKGALVNDIVYAPLQTKFLKDAQASGFETVTGIGMLLYQAQQAFRKWFHVNPEVDEELTQKVLAQI